MKYLQINIDQYLKSPLQEACKDGNIQSTPDRPFVMIDFVLFNEDGTPIEVDLTKDTIFEAPSDVGPKQAYFFRSGLKIDPAPTSGAYSAFLAFDQSGSIINSDPNDTRISAGQLFLRKNSAPDEVGAGTFNGDRSIRKFDTPNANGVFINDGTGIASSLESLRDSEDGGTPLYDAVAAFSKLVADKATQANKAVVVFSDGKDTTSKGTIQQAIQTALDNKVQIHAFALDSGDQDLPKLQQLAYDTRGAFMYASSAKQLIAMYGSLGNLLRKDYPIYRTFWQLQIDPTTAPNCFPTEKLPAGVYTCPVPAKIIVKTPKGDVGVVVNYSYSFRVV